jgi:hypothetical protein
MSSSPRLFERLQFLSHIKTCERNCAIVQIALEKSSFPYIITQIEKLFLMCKKNVKLVEKQYVRETEF